MSTFAALSVSQEATAVCVVDETGRILAERKIPTCPAALSSFLARHARLPLVSAGGDREHGRLTGNTGPCEREEQHQECEGALRGKIVVVDPIPGPMILHRGI